MAQASKFAGQALPPATAFRQSSTAVPPGPDRAGTRASTETDIATYFVSGLLGPGCSIPAKMDSLGGVVQIAEGDVGEVRVPPV